MPSLKDNVKPFANLLNSPADFERVVSSLEHTIMASFEIDFRLTGMQPRVTDKEVKRRFDICEQWFRTMRMECGFGLTRTLDVMPRALAATLLGQSFDPTKFRQSYDVTALKRTL
jgi:hypothetical protein